MAMKNRFKPASNFVLLIVQSDTSVVVLFVLCLGVYNSCSFGLQYVFIVQVPDC